MKPTVSFVDTYKISEKRMRGKRIKGDIVSCMQMQETGEKEKEMKRVEMT